ncbi:MAG: DUF3416 domain-containing protein [Corynebacterium marinum]|uniref:Alpha-1,4-glucan:maltose-1-phosphate maltosyltransferase n=1 Tax=Corynebacterium marinum TaxID=349751 RepID=A0A847HA10_9CORY|nr:DUF3416 domain-containing protein [Corynebacterium marinum]
MTGRLGIDDVRPQISGRLFPAKAVVGEVVPVTALAWREGHDAIAATLNVTPPAGETAAIHMTTDPGNQDRVHGVFVPDAPGTWTFRVDAWSDPFATWRNAVTKKMDAGQSAAELANDLAHGADLFDRAAAAAPASVAGVLVDAASALRRTDGDLAGRIRIAMSEVVTAVLHDHPLRDMLTRGPICEVKVERRDALVNSWYELFPRSTGGWDEAGNPVHGTFATTAKALERVAAMGFDTVYFPPIHPIGEINRKGRNNTLTPEPHDVGSPWAIGSAAGGHDAIHPELGTVEDFRALLARADELGLEIALDLALQASPDHPWVAEHPEWFTTLPDGTIAYAENPPKKYQDIYPLNFDDDPDGLSAEVLRVVRHWIAQGVRIFRVDNPHTKPLWFWEWLITKVHEDDPGIVFLAEAFTRPAPLRALAAAGFQQSYTYFTWRNTKAELEEFLTALATETADYLRPNLFVNTPDILTEYLQFGGRAAYRIRAAIAATAAPVYGVYAGYELFENVARPGAEENIDNEKYEYKLRDFAAAEAAGDSLAPFLRRLNEIRAAHPALRQLRNLSVNWSDDDGVLVYVKHLDAAFTGAGRADTIIVVVNVDPHSVRETTVHLDTRVWGVEPGEAYEVEDLLSGSTWTWRDHNYVRLDAFAQPVHIVRVKERS